MKFKNIILIVSLLITAIACSNENDVLNQIDNNNTGEGNAFVAFSIQSEPGITKTGSSTPGSTEQADAITNCSLILFNDAAGTSVYRAYDGLKVNNNGVVSRGNEPFYIQVKESGTFYAMVIANSNQPFSDCANLSAVQNIIQENPATALVKVNKDNALVKVEVKTTDLFTSISSAVPVMANITLQQISAQIRIQSFTVTGWKDNSAAVPVTINSIKLNGLSDKSRTMLNGSINTIAEKTYTNTNWITEINSNTISNLGIGAFTFGGDNDVEVTVNLSYDNTNLTRSFIINRDGTNDPSMTNGSGHVGVKSGYIYDVYIEAKLTGGSPSLSAKVNVLPWTDGGILNYTSSVETVFSVIEGKKTDDNGVDYVALAYNNGDIKDCPKFQLNVKQPVNSNWILQLDNPNFGFRVVKDNMVGEIQTDIEGVGKDEPIIFYVVPKQPLSVSGNAQITNMFLTIPDMQTLGLIPFNAPEIPGEETWVSFLQVSPFDYENNSEALN